MVPLLDQPSDWLEQCVRSALSQTVSCEVVVVYARRTGSANRQLLERLSCEYSSLVAALEPERGGFAAAINAGFELAAASRVGLLLSDDWLAPTAVEECLNHSADVVSTGVVVHSADGTREILRRNPVHREYEALSSLQAKASYLTHFFLFRKQTLLAVGGVDETVGLTGPDDYDLIWTLLEHEASIATVSSPLYHYRDHSGPRLSLRAAAAQRDDLAKILSKHKVYGEERRRLIEDHSRWYGRRVEVVLKSCAEDSPNDREN